MTLINLKQLQLSQLMDSLANMDTEATSVRELFMVPLFRCVGFVRSAVSFIFSFSVTCCLSAHLLLLPVLFSFFFSRHFFDFDIFGV